MATTRREGTSPPPALKRRSLLRIGGLGALGFNLADLARAEATARAGRPAIDSCIFLFYYGGPSHLDTYDMNPEGPPRDPRGLQGGGGPRPPACSCRTSSRTWPG